MDKQPSEPQGAISRNLPIVGMALVSMALLFLWGFPLVWYTHTDAHQAKYWLSPLRDIDGWSFEDQSLDEAMERRLVADTSFNGQFTHGNGDSIQAFMAKRSKESVNEIGLFVHTPDRCWTEGGWKIQPIQPDWVRVEVDGIPLVFERRLFTAGGRDELVYFTGMVGGQALPYRLDHNLSVAMKYQRLTSDAATGTGYRFIDTQLWKRVWESFVSRRPLLGPKQFIRLSTSVGLGSLEDGDRRLQAFLKEWLKKTVY